MPQPTNLSIDLEQLSVDTSLARSLVTIIHQQPGADLRWCHAALQYLSAIEQYAQSQGATDLPVVFPVAALSREPRRLLLEAVLFNAAADRMREGDD